MKILFISTKGPLPTNDGHCLRTFNLLQQVAKKHKVYLVSSVKFVQEYDHIDELKKICKHVEYFSLKENLSRFQLACSLARNLLSPRPFVAQKYDDNNMRQAIGRLINENDFDVIHIDMLPLACYLDLFVGVPVVLNAHNVESDLLLRQVESESNWLRKWYFGLQERRLSRFEKWAFQAVEHVAVCSEQDRKLALQLAHDGNYSVVPNGVDADFFQPPKQAISRSNDLIFVGGLNWYPNFDGLRWFDQEVMPKILKKRPDIKLHAIGRKTENVTWCHADNILFHGFVNDVRPLIASAAVFIVPLRIGGGTRLKILDAMAMGKAIVSTTIGAEGINALPESEIVLADTGDEFSSAILELLDKPLRRKEIGSSARLRVQTDYRWEVISAGLMSAFAEAKRATPHE